MPKWLWIALDRGKVCTLRVHASRSRAEVNVSFSKSHLRQAHCNRFESDCELCSRLSDLLIRWTERTTCQGWKFTVTVLEHVWVPASHTLYMKLAWPVVPVESSYEPSFGVVAITAPSRLTSILFEVAPLQVRREVFIPCTFFPRALSVIGPDMGKQNAATVPSP